MPVAPCRKCTDRKLGCHSKCEGYLKFRAELDEYNRLVRISKESPYMDKGWGYYSEKEKQSRKGIRIRHGG